MSQTVKPAWMSPTETRQARPTIISELSSMAGTSDTETLVCSRCFREAKARTVLWKAGESEVQAAGKGGELTVTYDSSCSLPWAILGTPAAKCSRRCSKPSQRLNHRASRRHSFTITQ